MSKKKKFTIDELPKPDELMQELSGASSNNDQSIEEWRDWLLELKDEVKHWIELAENDLENS